MAPDCPITEDELNALVDDQLCGRDQRRVAAHVAACQACSEFVGGTLASKRLLAARGHELEPPACSWDDLVAALDATDRVARTSREARRRREWVSVPALAGVGVILIAVALVWTGRYRESHSQGASFVQAHLDAAGLSARIAATPRNVHDVVTPVPGGAYWQGVARSYIPLGGELVEHTLFRVDRTPISEFLVPIRQFERTGLEPAHFDGAWYMVRAERAGSVVAWEDRGMVRMLVGCVGIDEMLSLAAARRERVPLAGGM